MKQAPHYHGHRQRLRARLKENAATLADYELLELLLGYVYLRRDTKPLAKTLLERFGSLRGVFSAHEHELTSVDGVGEGLVSLLTLWRESASRQAEQPLRERQQVVGPEIVAAIAQARLGSLTREEFWVALLDADNRLIGWEKVSGGTVDKAVVFPRDVFAAALRKDACALIVVHNHPSGQINPSTDDKVLTQRLAATSREIGVKMLDHLIVTRDAFFSFCSAGLLT